MACEKYKSYQKPENLKHKLHFTGSSTVSYDGSNDVTVNIPSSGDATNGSLLIKADNNDYISFDGGENKSINLRSGSNVRIDKATTGGENLDLTINATDTKYDVATPSKSGLMSAEDKNKLNGIEDGANNYTYTLPTATSSTLGGVTIGDNITTQGSKISITKENVTNALGYTPSATDTKYDVATPSKSGLMSASDKTKLDSLIYAYPVGSVYISISSNFNPNTSFGGAWERFGQGRTLIGEGTGDDGSTSMSFTANSTGGEYKHKLTVEEMPSHSHRQRVAAPTGSQSGTQRLDYVRDSEANLYDALHDTYPKGKDAPHNNVQPYITVYFWKRTA